MEVYSEMQWRPTVEMQHIIIVLGALMQPLTLIEMVMIHVLGLTALDQYMKLRIVLILCKNVEAAEI